jgi:CheY-like chemotaxis protein
MRASVLVVDDEEAVRELIATTLRSSGANYEVAVAADAREALTLLRARRFDALLTDLKMPGMDGMTLIREARALDPDLAILIITAVPSQSSAIEAVNLGVTGYLTKPFRVPHVLETVARAVRPHAGA